MEDAKKRFLIGSGTFVTTGLLTFSWNIFESKVADSINITHLHYLPYAIFAIGVLIIAAEVVWWQWSDYKRKQDTYFRLLERVVIPQLLSGDKLVDLLMENPELFKELEKLDLPEDLKKQVEITRSVHTVASPIVDFVQGMFDRKREAEESVK